MEEKRSCRGRRGNFPRNNLPQTGKVAEPRPGRIPFFRVSGGRRVQAKSYLQLNARAPYSRADKTPGCKGYAVGCGSVFQGKEKRG